MSESGKKVIVGISGGVDSSVSAYLLKQQGYDVTGVFMKNWEADDSDEHCTTFDDLSDATDVCKKLDIPLVTVNFAKQYWEKVFQLFLDEYQAGRTPNPDILCNKEIKFKAFFDYAMELGADYIATGHYAQCKHKEGMAELHKSRDRNKDQSYFLYAINQQALSKTLFPLGKITKKEVRQIAMELGLITHDKKDSTGICFIGERNFTSFLKEYLLVKPGPIKTPDGLQLGTHDGLMYYTLGQRKGLHIGGLKNAPELPWFVADKDLANNTLIIAQDGHPMLYSQGAICDKPDWISGEKPAFPLQCMVKTRYRQPDQPALITETSEGIFCVMFSDPQRAVTPGQSMVIYQGNRCLGGMIIDELIR